MTSSTSCDGIRRYPNPTPSAWAVTDGAVALTGHIRDNVNDELRLDPQITEPHAFGVDVTVGAVTITCHVATNAQKLAAVRAAERIEGVKAVANEIKVELAGMAGTTPISPRRSPHPRCPATPNRS